MARPHKIYDCLIIGGGPAGLSTALGLGRVSRTCVVFSHGKFRNDGIEASHAVLGHDHIHPQKIWARGRQQIERYGNTSFVEAEITKVQKEDLKGLEGSRKQGFRVESRNGEEWFGRTLVLATGVNDMFPDLPGYAENWPSNIYQCLFCDGFEKRKSPRGILCLPSFSSESVKMASMLRYLDPESSSKVTVFTNGEPNSKHDQNAAKALKQLAANGIKVDTRTVVKLENADSENGMYVHLKDKDGAEDKVFQGFVFNKPRTEPNAKHIIQELGLEITAGPFGDYVKTQGPMQATNVSGVFSAGDSGTMMTHVTNALLTGVGSAGGIAHYLNDWDDQVAMEAYEKR